MATRAEPKTRSILIDLVGGQRMVVNNIPSNAKITLGPVSPGKAGYEYRDIALRIYTTVGNQLAVFRNVISFRDLSLDIQVEEITVSEEYEGEDGPHGSSSKRARRIDREFVPQAVPAFPAR